MAVDNTLKEMTNLLIDELVQRTISIWSNDIKTKIKAQNNSNRIILIRTYEPLQKKNVRKRRRFLRNGI